jgi:Flp pilus assembly pilin Flp
MKNFLLRIWQEEDGAETAEWLVIVSLITGVGVLVYNGVLYEALTGLVGSISGVITGLPGPVAGG